MFETALVAAFGEAMLAQQRARAAEVKRQRDREQEEWEDENLLPLMSVEDRKKFLAERVRIKERREDIERQERHHRQILEAEREKARAIRAAGECDRGSFLRGFIWGQIVK